MSTNLEKAAAAERAAQESFERSDTDGFMSQWASGLSAEKYRLKDRLEKAGGKHEFAALFDLEGNLVPAKLVDTQYGMAWALLESEDPSSRFVGWVNRSKASTAEKRAANLAKKGYAEGRVRVRAYVDLVGANVTSVRAVILRGDGGFSADAEIVSTGGEG